MGWDRKRKGPASGYFYQSVRTPHGVKKVYFGRGTAGKLAAAAVEQRRQARLQAQTAIQNDKSATVEADRLAQELTVWADLLASVWLTMTGHRYRRGEWRKPRG